MKDHRDYGSVLTLSVLLSHPERTSEGANVEETSEEKERRRKAGRRSRRKKKSRQERMAASEAEVGRGEAEVGREDAEEDREEAEVGRSDELPVGNARSLECATRLLEATAPTDRFVTPTELLRLTLERAESAGAPAELGRARHGAPAGSIDGTRAGSFGGGDFFTWLDGEPH
eukprot:5755754-Prymnesium_polylepis.1